MAPEEQEGDARLQRLRPVPAQLLEHVAARFQALADGNRLRLLEIMLDRELCVNDLAAAAHLTQANTSKHLRVLCNAGLISRSKKGRHIFYTVASDTPLHLLEIVAADVSAQLQRDLAGLL